MRNPEPLSYLPEQVSPASRVVMNPVHMTQEVARQEGRQEFFRAVQLPRVEIPPEPRLNISMTLTDYEQMTRTFQARLDDATRVGQEQGAQAMNDIIVNMSQFIERLYK